MPERVERTTLKDVARRANVSIKTVSNVVHNRTARVSPATRERIQQAIAELDYRPNLAARQLRKAEVGIIALAVPTLENPYFATIASLVVEAGASKGRIVLVDHTNGMREQELMTMRGLRPDVIDGIIFDPQTLSESDITGLSPHLPVVLIGERLLQANFDHVLIDNEAAAFQATMHLVRLGYRRIAAIGVTGANEPVVQGLRYSGYLKALDAAGLPRDLSLVKPANSGRYIRHDGAEAMRMLLVSDTRPDAIFCFNDLMAIGAMRMAKSKGLRIPDDIAVIGIDDIEEGRYHTPSLSTIAPDKQMIARLATDLLIQRIEGKRAESPRHHIVPFELIARESTVARH
jgi:DNA-binding LacI/PurR family transcriptional regulator